MKKSSSRHNHWIDKLALGNAFLSGVTLYPQLFLLLTAGADTTDSISRLSFILIVSNSLIWLWYGVHRKTYPLIISSTLNAFAAAAILLILTLI
jgi:uncharacterized protein with PQ loop repeat